MLLNLRSRGSAALIFHLRLLHSTKQGLEQACAYTSLPYKATIYHLHICEILLMLCDEMKWFICNLYLTIDQSYYSTYGFLYVSLKLFLKESLLPISVNVWWSVFHFSIALYRTLLKKLLISYFRGTQTDSSISSCRNFSLIQINVMLLNTFNGSATLALMWQKEV